MSITQKAWGLRALICHYEQIYYISYQNNGQPNSRNFKRCCIKIFENNNMQWLNIITKSYISFTKIRSVGLQIHTGLFYIPLSLSNSPQCKNLSSQTTHLIIFLNYSLITVCQLSKPHWHIQLAPLLPSDLFVFHGGFLKVFGRLLFLRLFLFEQLRKLDHVFGQLGNKSNQ